MRRSILKLILALIALAVLAAVFGCQKSQIDSAQAEVVRSYAQGLPSVLAAQTLDTIKPYATPNQVDRMRLFVIMESEENKRRMAARLVSQEIQSTTTLSDTEATVVAREEWSITYTDKGSGEVKETENSVSTVTYSLYKAEGQWRVDEVVSEKVAE